MQPRTRSPQRSTGVRVFAVTLLPVGVQDTHPATPGTSRLGTNTSVFSIPYKQVPRLPEETQEISQTRNT